MCNYHSYFRGCASNFWISRINLPTNPMSIKATQLRNCTCIECDILNVHNITGMSVFSIGCIAFSILKGVLHPWALFLKILCIFLKNKATSEKHPRWIWSEMFQGTQKSQFYFSRDHCCKVTVKNVQKSIFSMF